MAGKHTQDDIYQMRNYKGWSESRNLKNDTYEYRKFVERPNLDVNMVEIGVCTEKVLMNELKKPFNGRFYHTTDTNKFYFDFNNKRYQLNLFGGSGEAVDLSEYAKKADVPKKTSQLKNDSGFLTVTTLKSFLSENKYVTKSMLEESLSGFVKRSEFNTLSGKVNTLSGKVDALTGTVGTISGTVDTLSGKMDTVEGKMNTVEDNVSRIWDDIEDIKERISEFVPGSDSDDIPTELLNRLNALEDLLNTHIEKDEKWFEFVSDNMDSDSDSE